MYVILIGVLLLGVTIFFFINPTNNLQHESIVFKKVFLKKKKKIVFTKTYENVYQCIHTRCMEKRNDIIKLLNLIFAEIMWALHGL